MRLRDSDSKGICECITCGKREHWTKVQAGHFISRKYIASRWMGINVFAQCAGCNMQSGGQQWLYSKALERMYGKGVCDEIFEIATTGKRPTNDKLKEWIEYYEAKVAAILAEELRQIAALIEQYRKTSHEEYTWTDAEGKVQVREQATTTERVNEWPHVIAKDLYVQAARPRRQGELKVIGTT